MNREILDDWLYLEIQRLEIITDKLRYFRKLSEKNRKRLEYCQELLKNLNNIQAEVGYGNL